MAKISKTNVYNYDSTPNEYDFLLGTDMNDNGKTKSFTIKSIVSLAKIKTAFSGEVIPSYTPVVTIENMVYKLDPTNIEHQFAFCGFSTNGTSEGEICNILQEGELELLNWGLIPGQHYLAGPNGTLITQNNDINSFTKVIGYAVSSDKLKIINNYTTITK